MRGSLLNDAMSQICTIVCNDSKQVFSVLTLELNTHECRLYTILP